MILTYAARVLSMRPAHLLAYWRLNESSGTSVADSSGNGHPGTAGGVSWGQTGIGDGATAAGFNGSTGYVNVYSTGLRDLFSGSAGTIVVWLKADEWADGTERYLVRLYVDGDNQVYLLKRSTGQLRFHYEAANVVRSYEKAGLVADTWYCVALTWDKSADAVKFYLDGAQISTTGSSLGTWAGALIWMMIGAATTSPANAWRGDIAHVDLWDVALTDFEIATLAALPYAPLTWIDEVPGETPDKFTITDDIEGEIAGSATIELTSAALTGTAYNASNFNHLEQGIADLEAETLPAILTAKGDLVVASAAQTAALLGVGDPGDYLTPDSGEPSGLKWAPLLVHGLWTSLNWDDPRYPDPDWYSSAHLPDVTHLITAASEFDLPATARAILINLSCRFISRYVGVTEVYLASPANVSPEAAFLSIIDYYDNMTTVGSLYATGWVSLDANGQFALRTVHDKVNITLTVLAYMQ